MTVKIEQRIPDKDTLERSNHLKRGITQVDVYRGFDGSMYVRLENKEGKSIHFSLQFFDFAITEN